MKEDYLWDKTGRDPEIESLEKTLSVFRQKDPAPPPFLAPVPEKAVVNSPLPRIVTAPFALAGGLAGLLLLGMIWFQIFHTGPQRPAELADTSAGQDLSLAGDPVRKVALQKTSPRIAAPPPVAVPDTAVIPARIKRNKPPRSRRTLPAPAPKKALAKRYARSKTAVKRAKPKIQNQSPDLTPEEKHAYRQLLLALTITSEKLNLVRDKVRGEANAEVTAQKKLNSRSN